MLAARFRQGQYDRRIYEIDLSPTVIASVVRTDDIQDIVFTDQLQIIAPSTISFRVWGGFPGVTHTMYFTVTDSESEVVKLPVQLIVNQLLGNCGDLEPPPDWPYPPPSGDVLDLDAGEFTETDNTGSCPA